MIATFKFDFLKFLKLKADFFLLILEFVLKFSSIEFYKIKKKIGSIFISSNVKNQEMVFLYS